MIKRALVVMAKQPRPGQTKTRLTPPLSPEQAAALSERFLLDKFSQMRLVPDVDCFVAYTPDDARPYFIVQAPTFSYIQQQGNTLSRRLVNVFDILFKQNYQRIAAIDGDTPHLPYQYLKESLDLLDVLSVDVTIGPTVDGGYYVIGLKQPQPTLFDVEMSTPHVIRDTLTQAQKAGLRVSLTPEWYDIDTIDDIKRLYTFLQIHPDAAPETADYLRHLDRITR